MCRGSGGDKVSLSFVGVTTHANSVQDHHDGVYTLSFTPSAKGRGEMWLRVNGTKLRLHLMFDSLRYPGVAVCGSPFAVSFLEEEV